MCTTRLYTFGRAWPEVAKARKNNKPKGDPFAEGYNPTANVELINHLYSMLLNEIISSATQ